MEKEPSRCGGDEDGNTGRGNPVALLVVLLLLLVVLVVVVVQPVVVVLQVLVVQVVVVMLVVGAGDSRGTGAAKRNGATLVR
jgi:Flp pilus assembly protein TadB